MLIRVKSFPRAALIGNPSDGYYGKTIAFVFRNYCAETTIYESPELEILPSVRDYNIYSGIKELYSSISLYGYYGGIRLLKACIKKFYEYTQKQGICLDDRNFTLRYQSTIPNRLGMAGSSAIISATMRALMKFYNVQIPRPVLPGLVLSVENEELGIQAGLQDRVAQVYNEPVYMDFNREHMEKYGYGIYTPIHIPEDMKLYIAYRTDLAEGSEVLHSRLRDDYESGKKEVHDAVREWADLTDRVKSSMENRDFPAIPALLNRNFDLRCAVCSSTVSERNRKMVQIARMHGASAKFTGSGGAIIGTCPDDRYDELCKALGDFKVKVLRPDIVTTGEC